jgi:TRAP transporter TAXI family solute receptor
MARKKIKIFAVLCVLALCLGLAGPSAAAGPQKLSMATFTSGSGWYIMGQAMAKIMLDALPKDSMVDVLPYSGGSSNPLLVHQGKADLALGFPLETAQAIKGVAPYKEKMPELKMLLGNLDTYWYVFAVRANVPVNSMEEIKAKKYPLRLVVMPKGSSGEAITRMVLNAYGITFDDIKAWGGKVSYVSFPNAVELMQNGQAEAFGQVCTPGHPSWMQLATTTKIRFLPMGEKQGQAMAAEYGFRLTALPKDSFPGVDKPVPVLGFATCLITTDKLPEAIAYGITKSICANRQELVTTYKGSAVFDPKKAADVSLPLHAGAKKYYQEAGYLKK